MTTVQFEASEVQGPHSREVQGKKLSYGTPHRTMSLLVKAKLQKGACEGSSMQPSRLTTAHKQQRQNKTI